MNAIIRNAISKAAADLEFTTKDEFMVALLDKLFPDTPVRKSRAKKDTTTSGSETDTTVPETEKKARKPRGKKAAAAVADADTETAVTIPEAVPEKKVRKAKKAEAPAEEAAPAEAEEKKVRKPKAKKEKDENQNMEKLNPTQTKKIKAIYDELNAGEVDKKAVLEFFNAMTPDEFNSKKFEEHIRAFLAPAPATIARLPASDDEEGEEVFDVTFKGKKYIVSMDKKVYATDANGDATFVVGNVGMAEFAEMKIDE